MNKISVLLNFKKVESDPYPYIMIQQALPEHIHNELLSTLPNEYIDQQESRDHHGKKTYHVNQVKKDGWKISNIWKELVELLLRQSFGEVICYIPLARDMSDDKLPLLDAINQPKESHIHGFGPLAIDLPGCYSKCNSVVHAQQGRRLGVSEVLQRQSVVRAYLR